MVLQPKIDDIETRLTGAIGSGIERTAGMQWEFRLQDQYDAYISRELAKKVLPDVMEIVEPLLDEIQRWRAAAVALDTLTREAGDGMVDAWEARATLHAVYDKPEARGWSREMGIKSYMMCEDPLKYGERARAEARREVEADMKARTRRLFKK